MDTFEQILEQYEPMISSIMRKTNVYKNYEQFRQSARIALWEAWRRYDSSRGPFAPYAYWTIQTTIYSEMKEDNKYTERQISYEQDKLMTVAQYMEQSKTTDSYVQQQLELLQEKMTPEEFRLLEDLYLYGYKYEELTEKYKASVAALKKRRNRLVKRLREQFS